MAAPLADVYAPVPHDALGAGDGVKLEDVNATFADGVLEVSVPLPALPNAKVHKVDIEEPAKVVKAAA